MIPPHARAILDALAFDGRSARVNELAPADLDFADRAQLTPLLTRLDLRDDTRARAKAALVRNTERTRRVAEAYREISFDHVLLKGVTHVPDFIDDPNRRVQYDLDLYVPREDTAPARDALQALGYEPIEGQESLAMDHSPAMIRKTGWQWRGDYFDPDFPPVIEVHFRFWDPATERLRVEGLDEFWKRRDGRQLALPDKLGYAALHLTRHLLRGNVRPFHVWELANFLHSHDDSAFWREWTRLHSSSARRMEAVAFLLAKTWFGCRVPDLAEEAIGDLPPRAHRWFEIYGWSPVEGMFQPNKHELWLHTALLASTFDRAAVIERRLIPSSGPGNVDAVYLPDDQMTLTRRLQRAARNFAYAASRAVHHVRLFAPTLWEGVRWWLRSK